MQGKRLARLQGLFNIANGAWPLLHMESFEAIFGPKTDRWLVRTVAGLLLGNGIVQFAAAEDEAGVRHARRVGLATAATLLAVDLRYAPTGRISRMYLLDAAAEAAWIALWVRSRQQS